MPEKFCIRTKGLTKEFGSIQAISDLNLEVKSGSRFGFLGPNGAGKTTTVRILSALLKQTSGTGTICGYDISGAGVFGFRTSEKGRIALTQYYQLITYFFGAKPKKPLRQYVVIPLLANIAPWYSGKSGPCNCHPSDRLALRQRAESANHVYRKWLARK